jgi:hypothetical protein
LSKSGANKSPAEARRQPRKVVKIRGKTKQNTKKRPQPKPGGTQKKRVVKMRKQTKKTKKMPLVLITGILQKKQKTIILLVLNHIYLF